MGEVRLEFTVEPFTEGDPGPHVRAAVDAVAANGLPIDFGPFSTTTFGDAAAVAAAVADLVRDAFAAGASRVALQLEAIEVIEATT
ncbi:MAG TPA: thiamine-binding protein [Acidimicrobiales bacterium]